MPRLSTSLICRARRVNHLLVLLLRTCRDLQSAANELRWLREHAIAKSQSRHNRIINRGWRFMLRQSCVERSRGKPLQYILGNQPFGELDILCQPGVLIPRPETEAYTIHLADCILEERLRNGSRSKGPLRILDLGTGTGCIPLLLYASLSKMITDIRLVGIDISSKAIALAKKNLRWNIAKQNLNTSAHEQISFQLGDIRGLSQECTDGYIKSSVTRSEWDILISNPPYISPDGFETDTSRSVRLFEPKSALVPPQHVSCCGKHLRHPCIDAEGDVFYPAILNIAMRVKAKLVILEVSDLSQGFRVASTALRTKHWDGVEIWRDEPKDSRVQLAKDPPLIGHPAVAGQKVPVQGYGNGRTVVCWKQEGEGWVKSLV